MAEGSLQAEKGRHYKDKRNQQQTRERSGTRGNWAENQKVVSDQSREVPSREEGSLKGDKGGS